MESELTKITTDLLKKAPENESLLALEKSMEIDSIVALYEVWKEYDLESISGIDWEHFFKEYLFKAAKRIEVRSVNRQHGASSLNY